MRWRRAAAAAGIAAAIVLGGGCAVQPSQESNSPATGRTRSAAPVAPPPAPARPTSRFFTPQQVRSLTAPLARVKEAGELKEIYLLGWEKDASINPRSRPPAFAEQGDVAAQCSPGQGLGDVSSHDGRVFIDAARFEALMQHGRELAAGKARWRFESERAQAQKAKLAGLSRRTASVGQGVAPRPRTPASTAVRPIAPGPAQQQNQADLQAAQAALEHNLAVLKKQDELLADEEREYTAQLIVLYEEAVAELQRVASLNSMLLINRFDQLRQNRLALCLQRARQSPAEQEALTGLQREAAASMKPVLVSNRASATQAMAAAGRLVADRKKVYYSLFSTRLLQEMALAELGIASPEGDTQRQGNSRMVL